VIERGRGHVANRDKLRSPLMHLLGLALGVRAATVKLALLIKCRTNLDPVPAYVKVSRPITRLIITGLILLTLSGIGWLVTDRYTFSPILITKLALVVALWVLGPVIDTIIERNSGRSRLRLENRSRPRLPAQTVTFW